MDNSRDEMLRRCVTSAKCFKSVGAARRLNYFTIPREMFRFDSVICDRLEHCQNISLRFDELDNYPRKFVIFTDGNTFPSLLYESIEPQSRDSERYVYFLLTYSAHRDPHSIPYIKRQCNRR